ncbi:glycosyltransferase [Demequina sp. NBRC 110057]|uniref:glycosyltransferase n=1 Tax=Demequina sp. NBRC 110057 TaxID=1570346 RepID=UPI000A069D34|nr:glycosyltransferase [Demequina sp. NBRC 110057]
MTAQAPEVDVDEAQETARRVVHRVVLPEDSDPNTLPLYVDFTMAHAVGQAAALSPRDAGAQVEGRRSLTLKAGASASFATYFNAFPAAYWRRWTNVESVRLSIRLSGAASVVVHKSNARGNAQRITLVDSADGVIDVDLPLTAFGDGGWYWFDLYAATDEVTLLSAEWSVDAAPARKDGTTSIAITTFNRPDYCVRQLAALGADTSLRSTVDRIYVIDQGTQLVEDEDGYDDAAALLGDRLRVIRQGNLGGSGGFSRGMSETLEAGESDYVLLLDDDIISEPEGILRAVAFGDYTRTPTIVGGHMFSMYERSSLHAVGETVNRYLFWWGGVDGGGGPHDFSLHPLRSTPWLHSRVDVDYNGWWMCLIPVEALQQVGLSLPIFIKWDDAEYCLRAAEVGIRTVSLPGAAVWHVPWTDKDDAIDWQAYYHQRNRWVAALLHSPYKKGGRLPRVSFAADVKHLLQLQYSAVDLRLQALEDILAGPDHLHATIGTTLPAVRQRRAAFPDAVIEKDVSKVPETYRRRPLRKGRRPHAPHSRASFASAAVAGAIRQFRPVREDAASVPEERVASAAARWWRLSNLDSALVTSADGSGVSMYIRDPEKFRSYLSRSIALHRRLRQKWPKLAAEYGARMPELTSPEAWRTTFAENPAADTK